MIIAFNPGDSMRRTTAPLALTTTLTATALLGLALLTPATAAAAETCRGETATHVGASGERVVGTEGRDVVVTNGSTRVTTLGGDDLVCVDTTTGGRRHLREVEVHTGAGNDLVDSSTTMLPIAVRAVLGTGTDRFEGGSGSDVVAAGDMVDGPYGQDTEHADTETDVLLGGPGSDHLTSGQQGVANADAVLGGGGGDAITYAGPQHTGAQLEGGAGTDRLKSFLAPGSTTVDGPSGVMTMAGGNLSWTAIESLTFVSSDDAARHLTYRGTGEADDLVVGVEGVLTLVADLVGGDDRLETSVAPGAGSTIDAGRGTDTLFATARRGSLDVDLRAGVLGAAGGSGTHSLPAVGFEAATIAAPRVRLAGTSADDDLVAIACRAEVSGRGGDDSLTSLGGWGIATDAPCRARATLDGGAGADYITSAGSSRDTIRGGAGHDRITGAGGPDRVTGGRGRDSVDGGPGPDTCDAERALRCER